MRSCPLKQPSWRPTKQSPASLRWLGRVKSQQPLRVRPIVACQGDSKSESGSSGGPSSLLSFFCPLLKVFGSDPSTPAPRWLDVTTSGLASIARLPYGSKAGQSGFKREQDPDLLPVVYEFEACPFCRRVREAVTDLDLTVEYRPCPKGSARHREDVMDKGGKAQFPFLVDPNTGAEIYESKDIVDYLYATYGGGAAAPPGMLETTLITGWMPTLLRAGRGMSRFERAPEKCPQELLQLYNYENNQFSRLVREVLCELELPFKCISAGKGSKNCEQLESIQGKTTVPYLVDPNTNKMVTDSEEIIAYLVDTYCLT